jgi:hypothetical protein
MSKLGAVLFRISNFAGNNDLFIFLFIRGKVHFVSAILLKES